MKRFINNELREVELVLTGNYNGTDYELVRYDFKPNQPVFYSFLLDEIYTPICNAIDLDTLIAINYHILDKGKIYPKTKDFWDSTNKTRKGTNFNQQYLF